MLKEVKVIQAKEYLTEEEANALIGSFLDDTHYDTLVEEDCDVFKPDGSPLIIFRREVLPEKVCQIAYPAIREAAAISQNRGYAAGAIPEKVEDRKGNRVKLAAVMSGTRARPLKKDGTVSNTNYAQEVESGIIGYFDRNARFPYCRTTAYTMRQVEKWKKVLPLIQSVGEVFKKECPERYAAQMEIVKKTSPDFVIENSPFTTVTVNRNWRTAAHKDAGDLKEGFGVMCALRAGQPYKGCYLVFPRYRVAVNMRTRDLLLAEVHEVHGNSPIIGIENLYERISLVLYYREKMVNCGTADEEVDRAKNRKRGDKING